MTGPVEQLAAAVAASGLLGTSHTLPARPLDDEQFDHLLVRCMAERITGLLVQAIASGHLQVTAEQAAVAYEVHAQALCVCLELERSLLNVVDVLRAGSVDTRVLKGSASAHLDYPDPSQRTFADVDILVRSQDFDTAVALLAAEDYRRQVPQVRPGFDRRFGKGCTLHGPTGHEVDLHRTFVSGPFGLAMRVDDLWATTGASFRLAGRELHALDADQRLVHACFHTALGGIVPRLVPQRDVAQLVLSDAVDPVRVREIAASWGAEAVVAKAVTLSWRTLQIADERALSAWARRYEPDAAELRALAAYGATRARYATRSWASLAALPDARSKAAFLVSLAFPTGGSLGGRRMPAPAAGPARHSRSGEPAMTKAKVLWLAKGLGRGGAEQLLVSAAPNIDRSRFDVEVAYVLSRKDALVPELRARDVDVHCLGQDAGGDPRWIWRLDRLLRQGRYDIVHTHMPVPAAAARILRGGATRAFVHTEHNQWTRYRTVTRLANAATYPRNRAVIAVSQAVADTIDSRRVRRGTGVEVLYHGIDLESVPSGEHLRAQGRVALGLPADAFVVVSVGNLTPKKDQRTLIDAIAVLRRQVPNIRLVLIGTGPLEAELRAYVRSSGLTDVVQLAGIRSDVPNLLPAFDVFALSSLYEGLSIALVEAMAAGLPCVATEAGGLPEAMTDDVEGHLVPPSDPPALARAIARIAHDPAVRERMSRAGVERARAFDIRRAAARISDIYTEVLAAS